MRKMIKCLDTSGKFVQRKFVETHRKWITLLKTVPYFDYSSSRINAYLMFPLFPKNRKSLPIVLVVKNFQM